MTKIGATTPATRPVPSSLRWTSRLLYALAAFQVLIAILLYLNWQDTIDGFTGKSFAPTRDAAQGAAEGALGVHVFLALMFVLVAARITAGRRGTRVRATILLVINIVAGVGTLFTIPDQTSLNPVGIVLAVAAIILLWVPSARAHFAPARR